MFDYFSTNFASKSIILCQHRIFSWIHRNSKNFHFVLGIGSEDNKMYKVASIGLGGMYLIICVKEDLVKYISNVKTEVEQKFDEQIFRPVEQTFWRQNYRNCTKIMFFRWNQIWNFLPKLKFVLLLPENYLFVSGCRYRFRSGAWQQRCLSNFYGYRQNILLVRKLSSPRAYAKCASSYWSVYANFENVRG